MTRVQGLVLTLAAALALAAGVFLFRGPSEAPVPTARPAAEPGLPAPKEPPEKPPPPQGRPAAIEVGDRPLVDRTFTRALAGFSEWMREGPLGPASRFESEQAGQLVEARLLARGWTGDILPAAIAIAFDPARSVEERSFAVLVLGMLAELKQPEAEAALLRMASSAEEPLAERALVQLAQSDASGACRDLYLRKCSAGSPAGYDAIGPWVDSRLAESWRTLVRRADEDPASAPEGVISAAVALKKVDALSSADWRERLRSILEDPFWEGGQWTGWALAAARVRAPELVVESLRKRLDQGMDRARRRNSDTEEDDRRLGTPHPSFVDAFATRPALEGVRDLFFDDVLVAYAQSGGSLTDLESRRLTTFGYIGDPKVRLAQKLAEDASKR